MRKAPLVVFFWILVLAVPFTALALSAVAFITDHLIGIAASLAQFSQASTHIGRPWLLEVAERLPEVVGMIVGQVIILIILLLARNSFGKEKVKNH